jgi:hypothetical protein
MEDIESFKTNENMTTLLPHLNGMLGHGIQIMVREEDYQKAKGVIDNRERITACPDCGSKNIGYGMRGKRRFGDRLLIILSVLFAIPMGNIQNRFYCKDCKADFE